MSAALQQYYPIENLVLYNTMFPQYARFISLDQKKEALYHIEHDFAMLTICFQFFHEMMKINS